MAEGASDVSVYVVFAEEGPAYDAVSQMSSESWGYNVEPPPLPDFLLENAVALLRRPKPGDAPPEGDLHNLDNDDPSIHKGLLVRFMRFAPGVDRLSEMMDMYRRNLSYGASTSDLQAMSKLKRRGCRVTRASLEYKASQAWKKRPWVGQGRYRYLLPVIFPEDDDIIEALGTSIQTFNANQEDDKSRIRLYSAQMVWNLSAAVTIQTAWRAYRTRKQYREAMRGDLLHTRAGKFIRDWVGWQIWNKRLVLCKAIQQICSHFSPECDTFLTADIRTQIEQYMKRQPPRVAREQRIRFTIDKEDRVVVVADPKTERQGLPHWTGLDIPVLTLAQIQEQGLPSPFPLGDISPLLLQGGRMEDVVYRPDKPRPPVAPEVRIRYVSNEEARNRICMLLTLTWHLHERRGIRMLQIPTAVQLLLQAIDPNAAQAKMMRLTEIYQHEESRIKSFLAQNFGGSAVRPFLEDLLLHGARAKLKEEEKKVFLEAPGGLIGVPPSTKEDLDFSRRFPTVREVPLLLDKIYEEKLKHGGFTLRPEISKSIGAAAGAPRAMLPQASSSLVLPLTTSTYFQPTGYRAAVSTTPLIRAVDGVHSETSILLTATLPPAETKALTYGAKEARAEMFMMNAEKANDIRAAKAEWEALMHLELHKTYTEKFETRIAVITRPRLEPRSLRTDFSVKPLSAPDILPSVENAKIVQELRTIYTENAKLVVERERSAHKERLESIKKERKSELQDIHATRVERKQKNERMAATARDLERTVLRNVVNHAQQVQQMQRGRAQTLANGAAVVRRLTSVANLLVKQQRQQERERHLEGYTRHNQERRELAAKWSENVKSAREGRRELQRTRREREMVSNLDTIAEQRARSARSKVSQARTVREEERVRSTLVPPAGGTLGSVAKELHIGKRVAPLSSVMSAAEVAERKAKIITTDQLRGWSPAAGTRLSSTLLQDAAAAAEYEKNLVAEMSTNLAASDAGGWDTRTASRERELPMF